MCRANAVAPSRTPAARRQSREQPSVEIEDHMRSRNGTGRTEEVTPFDASLLEFCGIDSGTLESIFTRCQGTVNFQSEPLTIKLTRRIQVEFPCLQNVLELAHGAPIVSRRSTTARMSWSRSCRSSWRLDTRESRTGSVEALATTPESAPLPMGRERILEVGSPAVQQGQLKREVRQGEFV